MHGKENLRRQHYLFAPGVTTDGPPNNLFRRSVRIHVRGIPEGDTGFDGIPEQRFGGVFAQTPGAEPPRLVPETHAAQHEPTHPQAGAAQTYGVHVLSSRLPLLYAQHEEPHFTLESAYAGL